MNRTISLDVTNAHACAGQQVLDLERFVSDFSVLFVYPNVKLPWYPMDKLRMPHLGLAILSSCVKAIGATSDLCDLTTVPHELWSQVLESRIKKARPDLVAITSTSMQWPYARVLCEVCKRLDVPHVVGGAHPTDDPEGCMEWADVVVLGEGEGALLDIVRACAQQRPLAGIANTWVRTHSGDVIKTPKRDLIEDLDTLPFPDWTLFHRMHHEPPLEAWSGAHPRKGPNAIRATIEGSRGCPYQCTYCSNTAHMKSYKGKGAWRREKSPARMVAELVAYRQALGGLDRVMWVDEIFMTNEARIEELCTLYEEQINVPFSITERPENISERKIQMMAEAGLRGIAIGFESGDEAVRRDTLNRKTKEGLLKQAFDIPRRHNVKTLAFTMVGLPGQDEHSMLKTWQFIRQIRPSVAQFTVFRPMRGTVLYDECVARGLHDPENDTTPWRPLPVIKHDLLDDETIIRYHRMLSEYATERGLWPLLAFHLGRRFDWACRLLQRTRARWFSNKHEDMDWLRNTVDVISEEFGQWSKQNDQSTQGVEIAC